MTQEQLTIIALKRELESLNRKLPVFQKSNGEVSRCHANLGAAIKSGVNMGTLPQIITAIAQSVDAILEAQAGQFSLSIGEMQARKDEIDTWLKQNDSVIKVPGSSLLQS